MTRCSGLFVSLVAMVAASGACAPSLSDEPPVTGMRPAFSPDTGVIPLPTELLKDQSKGRLNLPIDTKADAPLTQDIKKAINHLDGWPQASAITLPFMDELDPASVNRSTVLLYDVTARPAVKLDKYHVLYNVGRSPATSPPYLITVRTEAPSAGALPADFLPGHKFVAVVLDTVRAKSGKAWLDAPGFFLLRARTSFVDALGHSTIFLPDDQAKALEPTRAFYNAAFESIETLDGSFDRKKALSYTAFSVESGPHPMFNPTPIGNILPTPFDTGSQGAAALTSTPAIFFDGPVDVSTVPAGTHLYKFDAGALTEVAGAASVSATADDKGRYALTIKPQTPLGPSTTYVAVLTDAIKGRNGVGTTAGPVFSLTRYADALLDTSKNPAALTSPLADSTLDALISQGIDPATATQKDWDGAYSLLVGVALPGVEALRSRYTPYFDALAKMNVDRWSVTALWSFTTAAH